MTCCTFGAEEFVSFFDACLQIRWRLRNTVATAPINQDMFRSRRKNGFEVARLLKRVELDLSKSYDYQQRSQRERNKRDEDPAPQTDLHLLIENQPLNWR